MHLYRSCLIFCHLLSAFCSLPHLLTHITRLSFSTLSVRSQIAYLAYWINYCVLVGGILFWSIWILCRSRTVWQVIEVSGIFLIGKFVFTSLDLITRILLRHQMIVIAFDILHVLVLIAAILFTFLLAQHLKRKPIQRDIAIV